VVDDNQTPDNQPEVSTPETPAAPVKVDPPQSRFLFVDVAALRAKQLRRGARPRLAPPADGSPAPDQPRKPERVAMEEVRQGLVMFDVPVAEPEVPGEVE
jgi:DNA-directed RNA polymerase subunit K/omega